MSKGNYLNSEEAANLLGVNVSTIKRWTDSGKLNCMQTPGGHRKFLMKHINEFLSDQSGHAKNIAIIPYDTSEHRQINHLIQKHKIKDLNPILLSAALKSDRNTVNMIATGLALAQYPIYKIFDELVTPVLHQIGDLWEQGSLTVAEEHIASDLIRDSILMIREIIIKAGNLEQKVLCFALDDDQHDISLKMIQVLLEQKGFDVFFCGQKTPADSLEKLISQQSPVRIYLASTYFDEKWTKEQIDSKHAELEIIYDLSKKYGFEIFIGGQAFDKLNYDKNLVKRRLNTFKEVYMY
jgi:excisionase family DNA binding protein